MPRHRSFEKLRNEAIPANEHVFVRFAFPGNPWHERAVFDHGVCRYRSLHTEGAGLPYWTVLEAPDGKRFEWEALDPTTSKLTLFCNNQPVAQSIRTSGEQGDTYTHSTPTVVKEFEDALTEMRELEITLPNLEITEPNVAQKADTDSVQVHRIPTHRLPLTPQSLAAARRPFL
jgi:hypothetical protein